MLGSVRSVFVSVLFGVLFAWSPASAAVHPVQGLKAVPAEAAIEKYPVMPAVLTNADMVRLGLRPVALDSAWTGYNWYRNVRGGRFIYETLPKGTIVLVDKDGVIRYKADCGNRLIEPARCPKCVSSALFQPGDTLRSAGGASGRNNLPTTGSRGFLDSLSDSIRNAARAVWSGLGSFFVPFLWLLVLLAGLLLLPFLGWMIYKLFAGRPRFTATSNASVTPLPHLEAAPRRTMGTAEAARPPLGYKPPVTTPSGAVSGTAPVSASTSAPVALADPIPAVAEKMALASTRRFISCQSADGRSPHMLRFGGVRDVSFEEENGVTTIRFYHV